MSHKGRLGPTLQNGTRPEPQLGRTEPQIEPARAFPRPSHESSGQVSQIDTPIFISSNVSSRFKLSKNPQV